MLFFFLVGRAAQDQVHRAHPSSNSRWRSRRRRSLQSPSESTARLNMDCSIQKSDYGTPDDQGRVAGRYTSIPREAQEHPGRERVLGRSVASTMGRNWGTDSGDSSNTGAEYKTLRQLPFGACARIQGYQDRLGEGKGVTAGEAVGREGAPPGNRGDPAPADGPPEMRCWSPMSLCTQGRELMCIQVMENEPENEITITTFRLLVLDLLQLFQVLNQAMINILGESEALTRFLGLNQTNQTS